jgi:hypothetical protein
MDFHLNRKVALSQESKYQSLYKWSLQEHDDSGKQLGQDQVPWVWSVVFTATEMTLNEELKLEVKVPLFAKQTPEERKDGEKDPVATEESEYIGAKLRPGYFTDPDSGARYSMFGTDRAIKSFQLWIYKRKDETKPERCHAWGCLSYTTENDFRNETTDDTLIFYLHVSAGRFAQYVEMIRKYPANIIALRLGMVDGLYSAWSPSVSADRIKVLTKNLRDHQLTIPEGCAITLPTLGGIGEFSITFTTRRDCDKPPREIELSNEDLPEGVVEKAHSPGEEGLMLQRAALKLAVQHGQRMKYLSYAAWIIAVLLALIVLRQ